jgi:hypothetical protein
MPISAEFSMQTLTVEDFRVAFSGLNGASLRGHAMKIWEFRKLIYGKRLQPYHS